MNETGKIKGTCVSCMRENRWVSPSTVEMQMPPLMGVRKYPAGSLHCRICREEYGLKAVQPRTIPEVAAQVNALYAKLCKQRRESRK